MLQQQQSTVIHVPQWPLTINMVQPQLAKTQGSVIQGSQFHILFKPKFTNIVKAIIINILKHQDIEKAICPQFA